MSTVLIIILIVILLGGGGGWVGYRRYGYNSIYGGLGFIVLVLLVLWLLGYLRG